MVLLYEHLLKTLLDIFLRFYVFRSEQHLEGVLKLLSLFELITSNFSIVYLIKVDKSHQVDQLWTLHAYFNIIDFEINRCSLLGNLLQNKMRCQTYWLQKVAISICANFTLILRVKIAHLLRSQLLWLELLNKNHIIGLVIKGKIPDWKYLVEGCFCLLWLSSVHKSYLPLWICRVNLQRLECEAHWKKIIRKVWIVRFESNVNFLDLYL